MNWFEDEDGTFHPMEDVIDFKIEEIEQHSNTSSYQVVARFQFCNRRSANLHPIRELAIAEMDPLIGIKHCLFEMSIDLMTCAHYLGDPVKET